MQEQLQDLGKARQNNKKRKDFEALIREKEKLIFQNKLALTTISEKFKKKELPLNKVEYRPLSRPD